MFVSKLIIMYTYEKSKTAQNPNSKNGGCYVHILIGLFCLVINLLFGLKNLKRGIFWYIIFSFLLPNIHVNNVIITYELFAVIPIFIMILLTKRVIYIKKIYFLLFIYLILLLFSSLKSIILYDTSINFISYLGNIRFIILLFIYSQINDNVEDFFRNILLVIIIANVFVSFFQLTNPQSVTLFYKFYYSESLTPLIEALNAGEFRRAYGTFGSPINLGAFSLIAFSFFYTKILNKQQNIKNVVGMLCSFVTGLLSLTKTFLLGVPIVLFVGYVINLLFKGMKLNKKELFFKFFRRIIVLFLASILLKLIYTIITNWGLPIDYYLSFLKSPLKAFETRYDSEHGLLSSTMDVIKENLLIGVGVTNIQGEFIGDSAYIRILHDVGVLGALLFFILFILLFKKNIMEKDLTRFLLFFSLLICGLAIPVIISELGCLVLYYISINVSKGVYIKLRT